MIISAVKSLIASGGMCLVIVPLMYYLEDILPTEGKFYHILHLGILFTVGVIVYFVMAILLKMQEVTMVTDLIKRKFGRKKKSAGQQ